MKSQKQVLIEKAESAKRESKYLEFKESFDVDSTQDWCEIIKDIVAIANSGGGILIFGTTSHGALTNFDCNKILKLDLAVITDKFGKYTDILFNDLEVVEINRGKRKLAAMIIEEVRIPMVFFKPGTYPIAEGKQKTAFSQGTLYYRHGAKSEPCNSNDIKDIIERNLESIKKSWLGNIRKVVSAPTGSKVQILLPDIVISSSPTATPIRLTDDKSAPAFHLTKPDEIYKYRRKDIVEKLNNKLKGITIGPYDIQCIGFVYNIYQNDRFTYLPTYSSPQYGDAFMDWVIEQYKIDNQFFNKARQKYYDDYRTKK
jgi:hypothetical protein